MRGLLHALCRGWQDRRAGRPLVLCLYFNGARVRVPGSAANGCSWVIATRSSTVSGDGQGEGLACAEQRPTEAVDGRASLPVACKHGKGVRCLRQLFTPGLLLPRACCPHSAARIVFRLHRPPLFIGDSRPARHLGQRFCNPKPRVQQVAKPPAWRTQEACKQASCMRTAGAWYPAALVQAQHTHQFRLSGGLPTKGGH